MDPNDRKDEEYILAGKQLYGLALRLPILVPSLEAYRWVAAQSYSCLQEQAVQMNLRANSNTAGMYLWFVRSSSNVVGGQPALKVIGTLEPWRRNTRGSEPALQILYIGFVFSCVGR